MKNSIKYIEKLFLPIVINYFHYKTNILDVVRGNIKNERLVVDRIKSVLFHCCFLLLYSFALA